MAPSKAQEARREAEMDLRAMGYQWNNLFGRTKSAIDATVALTSALDDKPGNGIKLTDADREERMGRLMNLLGGIADPHMLRTKLIESVRADRRLPFATVAVDSDGKSNVPMLAAVLKKVEVAGLEPFGNIGAAEFYAMLASVETDNMWGTTDRMLCYFMAMFQDPSRRQSDLIRWARTRVELSTVNESTQKARADQAISHLCACLGANRMDDSGITRDVQFRYRSIPTAMTVRTGTFFQRMGDLEKAGDNRVLEIGRNDICHGYPFALVPRTATSGVEPESYDWNVILDSPHDEPDQAEVDRNFEAFKAWWEKRCDRQSVQLGIASLIKLTISGLSEAQHAVGILLAESMLPQVTATTTITELHDLIEATVQGKPYGSSWNFTTVFFYIFFWLHDCLQARQSGLASRDDYTFHSLDHTRIRAAIALSDSLPADAGVSLKELLGRVGA